MTSPNWRGEFVLASQERAAGRIQDLAVALRAGRLVRVSRGVYRHAWALDRDPDTAPDDAYLAVLRAAQLREDKPLIFAGMSAARIWGLPVVGAWPERAMVSVPREAGGRSNAHLARSYIGHPPPSTERGGLLVTSLPRTVADVARVESLERAVAVADAALRGGNGRSSTSKDAIAATLERLDGAPGLIRAAGVLTFADGLSGSAGESCSRVGMWRLGFPAPVLQHEFVDAQGLIGYADFTWPHATHRRVRRQGEVLARRVHAGSEHRRDRDGREGAREPASCARLDRRAVGLAHCPLAAAPRSEAAKRWADALRFARHAEV